MHTPSRSNRGLGSLLLLAVFFAAACKEDEPPVPVAIPRLVGLDPFGLVAVPVGVTHTIEVKLVDEAGEPARGYVFEWMHERDNSGILAFSASTPEPGTERLTVVANYPRDTEVFVRLQGGTEHSPTSWDSPTVKLRFYGGEPSDLAPYHRKLELRVGERRATGGFPTARVQGQNFLSAAPVTCTTADSSIARVDTHCVVTGLAPGETTLVLRHGPHERLTPLVVTEGPLAPPPADLTHIVTGAAPAELPTLSRTHANLQQGQSHEATLALDARGYPHFTAQLFPLSTAGTYSVLASWTGSGFGIEAVSRRWETGVDAQMAIDERGRIYVAYRDQRSHLLVLAERPGDGGPADWTYRHLDHEVPAAAALGISARELHEPNDTVVPALMPRPGGGVFVAFLDVTDAWRRGEVKEAVGAECLRRLRLVEVTDDALVHQDVAETRHAVVSTAPRRCHYEISPPHTSRVLLLPPAAGSTTPRLLNLHPMGTEGLLRYEQRAGAWSETVLVEPFMRDDGNVERPMYMTIVKPTPPGAEPQVAALMQARSSFESVIVVPGQPQRRFGAWFEWDASTNDLRLWGFRNADHVWLGGSHLRTLARLSPFAGGLHFDDLFEAHQAIGRVTVDDSREDLWGVESDGVTLDTVTDGPVYRRFRLPGPAAKPDGTPAAGGQRLSSGRRTARVSSPPVVQPDGSAYVHSQGFRFAQDDFDPEPATREPVLGQVLRSAGPGARFTELLAVDSSSPLFLMDRFWAVPGGFVGVQRRHTLDTRWYRSTDAVSWSPSVTIAAAPPVAEYVTPTGAAFVMFAVSQGYELWFSPEVQASAPFQRIATTPDPVLQNHALLLEAPLFGFTQHGDRVLFATTYRQHGTGAWRLHLRTFGLDGAELGDSLATLPRRATQAPRVDRLITTAAGRLIVSHLGATDELWRIDPATGVLEEGSLGQHRLRDLALARLPDGRLAAAFSDRDPEGRLRARVATSSDGLSWSAAVAVRPDGGHGQEIGGLAATPGGKLLVVLGDNQAFTSTLEGNRIDEPPLPDALLLRLPPVDVSILEIDPP